MKKIITFALGTGIILVGCVTANAAMSTNKQTTTPAANSVTVTTSTSDNVSSKSTLSSTTSTTENTSSSSIELNNTNATVFSESIESSSNVNYGISDSSNTLSTVMSSTTSEIEQETTSSQINSAPETITITNEQQAINLLKEKLNYDNDIIYIPTESPDSNFRIKLVSQTIRSQGVSGTIDQYCVTTDGYYFEGIG